MEKSKAKALRIVFPTVSALAAGGWHMSGFAERVPEEFRMAIAFGLWSAAAMVTIGGVFWSRMRNARLRFRWPQIPFYLEDPDAPILPETGLFSHPEKRRAIIEFIWNARVLVRETASSDGRFVRLHPKDIADAYKNHTTYKADCLLREFIGKYLDIEGQILDVTTDTYRNITVCLIRIPKDDPFVYCTFSSESSGVVILMNQGERIRVHGRIHDITSKALRLELCERLPVDNAPAPALDWLYA